MWIYQCQLAWRSIRKTPALCALIIATLAFGVAAAMVTYTSHHSMQQNPFSHKNSRVAMVQTDAWHEREAFAGLQLNQMSNLISYRDYKVLAGSSILRYSVPIANWGGTINLPDMSLPSSMVFAQLTSRDYFGLFETAFAFGAPWSISADQQFQPQIVLTHEINQRLFSGENSIGRQVLLEGTVYEVTGVLKPWRRGPKIENLDSPVASAPQVFIPLRLVEDRAISPWNRRDCPDDKTDYGSPSQALIKGSCQWLSLWVEFNKTEDKAAYGDFVANFIADQKAIGRYPRPLRYALSSPQEVLHINRQDRSEFYLYNLIGQALLIICLINAITLLLAKFIRQAPQVGIRRALGASRSNIFYQHLLESAFLGLAGSLLGLALTQLGLVLLKKSLTFAATKGLTGNSVHTVFVLDAHVMVLTLLTGLCGTLLAGIYPAWQICRTPIAQQLKKS